MSGVITASSVAQLVGTRAAFTVTRVVENTFTLRYASGAALFRHDSVRFGFLPGWKAVAGAEGAGGGGTAAAVAAHADDSEGVCGGYVAPRERSAGF